MYHKYHMFPMGHVKFSVDCVALLPLLPLRVKKGRFLFHILFNVATAALSCRVVTAITTISLSPLLPLALKRYNNKAQKW